MSAGSVLSVSTGSASPPASSISRSSDRQPSVGGSAPATSSVRRDGHSPRTSSTLAAFSTVAWAKLRALSEGAALASERLWQ